MVKQSYSYIMAIFPALKVSPEIAKTGNVDSSLLFLDLMSIVSGLLIPRLYMTRSPRGWLPQSNLPESPCPKARYYVSPFIVSSNASICKAAGKRVRQFNKL